LQTKPLKKRSQNCAADDGLKWVLSREEGCTVKQTKKLIVVLLVGVAYLGFHFYAMGYNAQNMSLHESIPHLDKWEHFTSGIIIASLIMILTEKLKHGVRYSATFSVVLFLAGLFEILEYSIPFNGQIFWGGIDDTVWDIIFAVLGALAVIAITSMLPEDE